MILNFKFGAEIKIINKLDIFTGVSDFNLSGDIGNAFAINDAFNSAFWGGMTDMRDANGNAVTDFSVFSVSGTDWAQSFIPSPVPLPPAVWLLGGALVVFGPSRIRR